MTAIVFGSPEAAEILRRQRIIAALEDMALDNADADFWISGFELSPEFVAVARSLVASGTWETDVDPDMFLDMRLIDYRPNSDEQERIVAHALQGGVP